jgi:hypothetical protein
LVDHNFVKNPLLQRLTRDILLPCNFYLQDPTRDQDPREEILKFANKAEAEPFFVAKAYQEWVSSRPTLLLLRCFGVHPQNEVTVFPHPFSSLRTQPQPVYDLSEEPEDEDEVACDNTSLPASFSLFSLTFCSPHLFSIPRLLKSESLIRTSGPNSTKAHSQLPAINGFQLYSTKNSGVKPHRTRHRRKRYARNYIDFD